MSASSVSGMIFGSKERLWRVRSVYQANVHLWFGVLTTVAVLNLRGLSFRYILEQIMAAQTSLTPSVSWAQRPKIIFLTINVSDVEKPEIKVITPAEKGCSIFSPRWRKTLFSSKVLGALRKLLLSST